MIAPADGRVVMITDVDEPSFVHGKATRISIFMNIFNVHVNRYPVSGTVQYVHYNPGKFINAAADKASLDNEQMSVGLEVGGRLVLVRQIAGRDRPAHRDLQQGRRRRRAGRAVRPHPVRLARGRVRADRAARCA